MLAALAVIVPLAPFNIKLFPEVPPTTIFWFPASIKIDSVAGWDTFEDEGNTWTVAPEFE